MNSSSRRPTKSLLRLARKESNKVIKVIQLKKKDQMAENPMFSKGMSQCALPVDGNSVSRRL